MDICGKQAKEEHQWLNWCRLCAKDDPLGNMNVFLQDNQHFGGVDGSSSGGSGGQSDLSLAVAIEKYFNVKIMCDECLPQVLCTECFSLVTSLENFLERALKIQVMFHALRNTLTGSENKMSLNELRLKYGLLDENRGHVFLQQPVPEVHYFRSKLKEHMEEENPLDEPVIEIKKEDIYEFENRKEHEVDNNKSNEAQVMSEDGSFYGEIESKKDILDLETVIIKSEIKVSESSASELEAKSPENNLEILVSKRRAHRGKRKTLNRSLRKEENKGGEKKDNCSNNVELISCPDCPGKFKRTQQFRRHMEVRHSKVLPKAEFRCEDCGRDFKTGYYLKKHMHVHMPSGKKIHPCMYCDKKFITPEYASHHMKYLHMTDKSFICEECGYPTRTSAALKEHMLTHTDHAPFECEVCEKKFKSQSRLKNHMEIHNPTKHICAECGLQLNSRPTLNRHLLIHSDEMRHKCDYCGRAFKRAKSLKAHLILHTGLKPYSCEFCDRRFTSGSNCRTHKKKSHPEELAALEASGSKTYTHNIPKLETLKALTKNANNLSPVVSKQSGCFAFGKKPKPPLKPTTENKFPVTENPTIDDME